MSTNLALVHGDIYPGYIAMLRRTAETHSDLLGVANEADSRESVNVAAGVGHTKGKDGLWIGMQVYVMCPNDGTAKVVIPAFAALVQNCHQPDVAAAILEQLTTALKRNSDDCLKDSDIWKGAPLLRNGVR